MLAGLFRILAQFSPTSRETMFGLWYQSMAWLYPLREWTFMNYGYAPVNGEGKPLELHPEDATNRYAIQLYHHVTSAIDLRDSVVLEVGSGRGGGADFINRTMSPRKMVGVDRSSKAVEFCLRRFKQNGLSFETGSADRLPFGEDRFDAVVNIESSHCYASIPKFLSEVRRVLRLGGYFLFADFRDLESVETLRSQIRESGFKIVNETDITTNIVEALERDANRKKELITKIVHRPLVRPFLEFAGAVGSPVYLDFKNRKTLYFSYVMQK